MGWSPVSPYKNVVRVILTEEGVYFCVWFPFRLCHPPFLLPWESVRRVEKKDSFLLGQSIHVDVMDPVGTMHLWLRKSVEQDLLKYFLALREPVRPVENV
ncbi:hypothetical protein DES53_10955 [Roseimicrobium gellanilyticum]|uniref:Uncharacterized protein n=1 Tax=Roseimicrobium gellanilyticum TaxID=748857 RepID=A0A366HE89_9BACT|nr:hypothetical protein [Roseimicrobium gellanilyticum]RBP39628.1 hypothetical protein DES53_10955 [Roseimicrobium gellanilyticum]